MDFTGDMPVILGPDGPSLGGFVCPVVVVDAELWKLGQLRPGDLIEFVPVDEAWARDRQIEVSEFIAGIRTELSDPVEGERGSCFIDSFGEGDDTVVVRRAGDRYFLIEFGPHHLDLKLRFKVHVVHEWLKEQVDRGHHRPHARHPFACRSISIPA